MSLSFYGLFDPYQTMVVATKNQSKFIWSNDLIKDKVIEIVLTVTWKSKQTISYMKTPHCDYRKSPISISILSYAIYVNPNVLVNTFSFRKKNIIVYCLYLLFFEDSLRKSRYIRDGYHIYMYDYHQTLWHHHTQISPYIRAVNI